MGFSARKTEHTGAKHGRGAYCGTKYEAKRDSRKIRRRNWKLEIKKMPEGVIPSRVTRQVATKQSSSGDDPCADIVPNPHTVYGTSQVSRK